MEQQLKEIVSEYINVPVAEIADSTIIDRSRVSSSIVLHRMYAKLAERGFKVDNYWNIKTVGQLSQQNNGSATATVSAQQEEIRTPAGNSDSVGIDIEEVSAIPVVRDFRDDDFYKMNFSDSEISHCILSPNPYASFTGLYAVKEAIVKCDNTYKNKAFNNIVISHSDAGKPIHPDFQLSLSHTDQLAVAVAISVKRERSSNITIPQAFNNIEPERKTSRSWLVFLALVTSVAALIISILY